MTGVAKPPELLTRADVAQLLEMPLRELTWWIWALRPNKRYERFEIPRRAGERPRVISAPIKPLKDVQGRLAQQLMSCYRPPVHVHGFTPGRGPTSNAKIHRRQQWILTVDLRDFFPSINFGRVLGMFKAYPFEYPQDVAVILAQICCHENELPQGAPTSPVISNLICRGMDKELGALAASERTFYSRYADDMSFSTDRRTFPAALASRTADETEIGHAVSEIIQMNGFAPNPNKTRLVHRSQRQRVTGLVVNNKVNISRDYIRSLRNLLYTWNKHGLAAAERSFADCQPQRGRPPSMEDPDFRLVIRGRVEHVGSIKGWTSPVYRRLALALHEADPEFRIRRNVPNVMVRIKLFTEGSTDVQHVLAAQQYFHARGEFLEFELIETNGSAAGNDSKLLALCQVLATTAESPSVCLFDSDSKTARKAVSAQGIKRWGDKVIAVGLVGPPWRSDGQPICIELLHEMSTLELRDGDGRRVFLREEFEERTPRHKSEDLTIPNAGNRTLIQEEVFDGDGKSVALTKADFADNVATGRGPFDDLSFEGFRPTFELLVEAASELRQTEALQSEN